MHLLPRSRVELGARSEHGSAPQAATAIFQLVRYF
jgi:hypothetical protein